MSFQDISHDIEENEVSDESESEDDDLDRVSGGESDDSDEDESGPRVLLADSFKTCIPKVRKISRLMRKSRKMNDCFQRYVKAEVGREMKLKMDTTVRWNREAIQ